MFIVQLLVVVDGTDVFRETVKLPIASSTIMADQNQYFLAGGAVSAHTKKKHLSLVNAEKTKLEWKLGSLSILNGTVIVEINNDHNVLLWFRFS